MILLRASTYLNPALMIYLAGLDFAALASPMIRIEAAFRAGILLLLRLHLAIDNCACMHRINNL